MNEFEQMADMEEYGGIEETTGWHVTNDNAADWAVRKIKEYKDEYERIKGIGDELIARTQYSIDEARQRYEKNRDYFTEKLAEYFETVPHRSTKTTEKYALLSGTLTKKKGSTVMTATDGLTQWLRDTGREEFIQVTVKPRWGEFKKQLEITPDGVVDTSTGDLVEGVEVSETPDTFKVDL